MVDDFIKNLTNPPERLEKGQVWYSNKIKEELLIIDNKYVDQFNVVRTMVISPMVDITDGNDVLIKSDEHGFLPSDRIALRFTSGPISKFDLNYFRGHIKADLLTDVIASENNKSTNEYTEIQKIGLTKLINKLELLRSNAVNAYEDQLDEALSLFKLPVTNEIDLDTEKYLYGMVAESRVNYEIENFWEKERTIRKKALVLEENDDLILRLSFVDKHLYLVIISETYSETSNVNLKSGTKKIKAINEKLDLTKIGRVFTSFDEEKLEPGEYTLSLYLDSEYKEFYLNIE